MLSAAKANSIGSSIQYGYYQSSNQYRLNIYEHDIATLRPYRKKTNQPTDRPTNRQTWRFIGKLHFLLFKREHFPLSFYPLISSDSIPLCPSQLQQVCKCICLLTKVSWRCLPVCKGPSSTQYRTLEGPWHFCTGFYEMLHIPDSILYLYPNVYLIRAFFTFNKV